MNKKIRVGIIGCGAIAQKRHLPEYSERSDVEIVAVCDFNVERANEIKEQYGALYAFNHHKDLLALEEVDAVSVCTPNQFHAKVSIEAMKAGKHVLCEKPMATTIEEAREMVKVASENNVFLMVGHNQRLMPTHVQAKQLLQNGKLGRVLTFTTTFGHGGPEGWSIDGKNSWFFNKDQAFIGAMGDLGVHKADLISWLIDDQIASVSAMYGTLDKEIPVDDNAIFLMKTRKGVLGTLTASWTYYANENNSTVLHCENGTMKIGVDPAYGIVVEYKDGTVEKLETEKIQTNEDGGQTHSGVIDHFIDGIVSGDGPEIDGREGLRALEVILAGMDAAQSGQTKTIED